MAGGPHPGASPGFPSRWQLRLPHRQAPPACAHHLPSAGEGGAEERRERQEPVRLGALQIREASQTFISQPITCLTPSPSINQIVYVSTHPPFIYLSTHLFPYPSFDCLSVHPSV